MSSSPLEAGPAISPAVSDAPGMATYLVDLFTQDSPLTPAQVQEFFDFYHQYPRNPDITNALWQELKSREDYKRNVTIPNDRTVDWIIDRMLGFDVFETEQESKNENRRLKESNPFEELWIGDYVWTQYAAIRDVVTGLNLTEDDVLYDLGAGYGRVPLYAGLTTSARCEGVELVPKRVEAAARAISRLGLANVSMTEGNVLEHDFSDGTTFFMYSPFSRSTHVKVIRELEEIAKDHPIRIAFRGSNLLYDQEWLVNTTSSKKPQPHELAKIYFYESL